MIWNLNPSIAQNLDLTIDKKRMAKWKKGNENHLSMILAQATKEMHTGRNVRQLNQVWELEHSGLVSSAWLETGS